jgi:voltage-gated potassium channel
MPSPDERPAQGDSTQPFGTRGARFWRRIEDGTQRAVVTGRVIPFLAGMTISLAFLAALAATLVDRKDFPTFGDALWWAVVTLGTVGYGDVVPTTPAGRILGGAVIVLGVTFLSFLLAVVTSYFVTAQQERASKRERERRQAAEQESMTRLREISERLDRIEARLAGKAGD